MKMQSTGKCNSSREIFHFAWCCSCNGKSISSEAYQQQAKQSTKGASSPNMPKFTTKWTMAQDDVNLVSSAGQWNTWALQVDGTGNFVTWLQQPVWQEINISLEQGFGAYISEETDLSDGTLVKAISNYPVVLGGCYSWTGSNLVPDISGSDCDSSSVMITNNSSRAWTFGLTKMDPVTQTYRPICADIVLQMQPVVYTPILAVFAKVGRDYKTASIITDIGSWSRLEINKLESTFRYNRDTSQWIA